PAMDQIETVPSVAQAIRLKLSSKLKNLKANEKVAANVVSVSCQIVNRLTTGSASFELQVEAQFQVSGRWHSRILVAGDSESDFKVGFKGVPAKDWCSEHFLAVADSLAKEAAVYYRQLVASET